MISTLIFATNNAHKVEEMNSIIGDRFQVVSLRQAGLDIEIPEPFNTLEENASEKSSVIYELTGSDCFSEDTGLEVFSLNMEPGVKSARYAGEGRSSKDNINKLLNLLEGKTERSAQFRTILSLSLQGVEYKFEGICKGTILAYRRGDQGFGYDPVFVPDGSLKTFAEMDMPEKNEYSHRKRAAEKMINFLSLLNPV